MVFVFFFLILRIIVLQYISGLFRESKKFFPLCTQHSTLHLVDDLYVFVTEKSNFCHAKCCYQCYNTKEITQPFLLVGIFLVTKSILHCFCLMLLSEMAFYSWFKKDHLTVISQNHNSGALFLLKISLFSVFFNIKNILSSVWFPVDIKNQRWCSPAALRVQVRASLVGD